MTTTQNPTARSRRTASTILYDGLDYERLSELKRATVAARNIAAMTIDDTARGGDENPVAQADRAYDEFAEQARQRATEVRVGHLGRRQWRALREQHQPRPDEAEDTVAGYNCETFPPAAIEACLMAPAFETAGTRSDWLDDLTDGEVYLIFTLAFSVNESLPADPSTMLTGSQESGDPLRVEA